MRIERLDYELPHELVAQVPAEHREDARLLLLSACGDPRDAEIAGLATHVAPGTLVVVNDTKVVRARILGVKEGSAGRVEVFLVRRIDDGRDPGVQRWKAMTRASKPLRVGSRVLKEALAIEVEGQGVDGLFEVRLEMRDGSPLAAGLAAAGRIPLPPYIKRDVSPVDEERYQTVFARVDGAVAAPTAGLHLTRRLLDEIEERGCEIASCTLHVGLGTFQPVKVDDLDQHPMHAEEFVVPPALEAAVARARERGGQVLAVGTTVVRALESARDPERAGFVRACQGETRLLIQPGFRFSVTDRLLTNFHLPRSTLLALVCAFAGHARVLAAYRYAVEQRYRFFSYGDAMLLDRAGTTA